MATQTHQLTLIVERDPDSNWLVGEILELPGCFTQAPNMAELEVNIHEAIAVYLETAENIQPSLGGKIVSMIF